MSSLIILSILLMSSLCAGNKETESKTRFIRDREILYEVGHPLTLKCLTVNPLDPNLHLYYYWKLDGDEIYNDDRYTPNLTIKAMTKNSAGQYQCFIRQWSIGKDTASDRIITGIIYNVKEKYVVIPKHKFEHKTVNEGEPFDLTCPVVEGYPVVYEWDYQIVSGKTVAAKMGTGLSSAGVSVGRKWYISNAGMDDEIYEYVCLISGAFELKVYYTVSLTIIPNGKKYEVVEQFTSNDTAVLLGQEVYLYCGYGGNPQPAPVWTKNGEPIGPNASMQTNNQTLYIKEVSASDAGVYSCIADNGVGERMYHSLTLSIDSEPYLMPVDPKVQNETVVATGSDAYLFCPVVGLPDPTRVWTHNSKEFTIDDDNVQVIAGGYYLYVSRARLANEGYYACHAENKYGGFIVETFLTVV